MLAEKITNDSWRLLRRAVLGTRRRLFSASLLLWPLAVACGPAPDDGTRPVYDVERGDLSITGDKGAVSIPLVFDARSESAGGNCEPAASRS